MLLSLLAAMFVQMGQDNILVIFCNFKSRPSVQQIELKIDIDGTKTHARSSLSAQSHKIYYVLIKIIVIS